MRIVAIIQARLNSTRLHNKILLPLSSKPMLSHCLERASRSKEINQLVVSCPKGEGGVIARAVAPFNVATIFESEANENDLIDRYIETAYAHNASIIVRLCADNPLVEPLEMDRAIRYYLHYPRIFVSNMHQHSKNSVAFLTNTGYPDGIGCEVFSLSRLEWLSNRVQNASLREHPHQYFHEIGQVSSPVCPAEFYRPDLKLDVNTQEEYEYIKDIFDHLYPDNPNFHITDVIRYLDAKNLVKQTASS